MERQWQDPDPGYWTLVDRLTVLYLRHLRQDDLCYYYLERSSGGYQAGAANQRVANFKKDTARFGENRSVMYYRQQEIDRCIVNFTEGVLGVMRTLDVRAVPVICPMPTSNPRDSSAFNDRLDLLAEGVSRNCGIPYMTALDMGEAVKPSHVGGMRDPDELAKVMAFSGFGSGFEPSVVLLFDDVLTSGAHFRACKDLILDRCPWRPLVVGMFLARHI